MQDFHDARQAFLNHAVESQIGPVIAIDGSFAVFAEEPLSIEEIDVVVLFCQSPHHFIRGVDSFTVKFCRLLIEIPCGMPVCLHENQRFVGMSLGQ